MLLPCLSLTRMFKFLTCLHLRSTSPSLIMPPASGAAAARGGAAARAGRAAGPGLSLARVATATVTVASARGPAGARVPGRRAALAGPGLEPVGPCPGPAGGPWACPAGRPGRRSTARH
jgi:hypothetical protein